MHIDLNEAIRIHARVSRTRFGRGAKKRALKTAQHLTKAGDHAGAAVWEQVAAIIDQADKSEGGKVVVSLTDRAREPNRGTHAA
jgi:hypothetical protein